MREFHHIVESFNFVLIHGNVISWMHRLSVSVGKLNLLLLVFVDDVNLWMRAIHEYHEN